MLTWFYAAKKETIFISCMMWHLLFDRALILLLYSFSLGCLLFYCLFFISFSFSVVVVGDHFEHYHAMKTLVFKLANPF